jgi:hypothetical protein
MMADKFLIHAQLRTPACCCVLLLPAGDQSVAYQGSVVELLGIPRWC